MSTRPQSSKRNRSHKESQSHDLRLHKYLSQCGVASRRHAEQLIREGEVEVNDKVVSQLGLKINPLHDIVRVRRRIIKPPERGVVLLNKPKNVVSTLHDPEDRPTVSDYMTKHYRSYFPVGRLDFESTGLIIMTNDGEMAERLMHPRYGFERVYHVRVQGVVNEKTLQKIEAGVKLIDGIVRGKAKFIKRDEDTSWLEIIVTEGRNRVVRRLMDKLRHPVLKLKRVSYGPFKLGKLNPGDIRKLTEKEYQTCRQRVLETDVVPMRK